VNVESPVIVRGWSAASRVLLHEFELSLCS